MYTLNEGDKTRIRAREWQKAHPEATRLSKKKSADKTWLTKFGELQEKQQGVCAICKQLASGMLNSRARLAVDHCHTTGKIRGLLCGGCNVGLGHFKDNPEYLANAIEYLKENGDVYV